MQRCLNTILGYAASLKHSPHALQVLLLPLSPKFPYDLLNMLLEKKISNLALVSSHRKEVVFDKRKKKEFTIQQYVLNYPLFIFYLFHLKENE